MRTARALAVRLCVLGVPLGGSCSAPFEGDFCALATVSEPCAPGKCLRVWCPQFDEMVEGPCYDSIEMDLESWRRVVVAARGTGPRGRPGENRWGMVLMPLADLEASWGEPWEIEVCESSSAFEELDHAGFLQRTAENLRW